MSNVSFSSVPLQERMTGDGKLILVRGLDCLTCQYIPENHHKTGQLDSIFATGFTQNMMGFCQNLSFLHKWLSAKRWFLSEQFGANVSLRTDLPVGATYRVGTMRERFAISAPPASVRESRPGGRRKSLQQLSRAEPGSKHRWRHLSLDLYRHLDLHGGITGADRDGSCAWTGTITGQHALYVGPMIPSRSDIIENTCLVGKGIGTIAVPDCLPKFSTDTSNQNT
ncbi:hypothetical protein RRG08_021104 [Elysia crispata]|uniref:Uncharacterized protein n=1 Tax=Elysia crispata TaxID=231223 RepID=A0AAE0Z6R2_9GAST|nr:hypothetical protein RRG08_021104 [Elysia crispata]